MTDFRRRSGRAATYAAFFLAALAPAPGARGQTTLPLRTIANPVPGSGDQFGKSAAFAGGKAIVGAPGNNFVFDNVGSVYVIDPTSGTLERTINNPAPAAGDGFGSTLAPFGANLLIGAPTDDAAGADSGSIYLFDPSDGQLLQTIPHPEAATGSQFGFSVAELDGDVLAGAPFFGATGNVFGVAYLVDPTTPSVARTFMNPQPNPNGRFGFAVAALPGLAIISSPGADDSLINDVGRVYIFDAATGAELRQLSNPNEGSGDEFGASLAAMDGTIVVGAPGVDVGAISAGAAYIFDAATGVLEHELPNPSPMLFAQADAFGSAVAAGGMNFLVGASGDDPVEVDSGSAYLFRAVSGFHARDFVSPVPAQFDAFGAAVAASGNALLIGAPGSDTGADDSGVAYLFANPGVTAAEIVAYLLGKTNVADGLDVNDDGVVDIADAIHATRGEE